MAKLRSLLFSICSDDAAHSCRCRPSARGVQTWQCHQKYPLDEAIGVSAGRDREIIAVHEALERLEALDARKSRVVELRFFGGLEVREIAEVFRFLPERSSTIGTLPRLGCVAKLSGKGNDI